MKKMIKDEIAATPTFEYIILMGILAIYLSLFLAIYSGGFELAPSRTAMQTQFEDVGNEIGSRVVDMYVTTPETGYLKTKFFMPAAVGKYEYKVEFQANGPEQEIKVSALRFQKDVLVTLNNIGTSLGLNGATYSASPDHWLVYSMGSQYNLTNVAIAYPRTAAFNQTNGSSLTVTFDGSYSKGLGKLQYTWDFGDGNISNNAIEHHQYIAPGIYNSTLTVYDPLLVRSASSSVLINVTGAHIEPGLDTYKFVSPMNFQVGEPAFIDIVMYGKGIPQEASLVDVMLVTDISGSMDPDYPGIGASGYTVFNKTTSTIQSAEWNQTLAVDGTFNNMSVEATSVNGTKDINLWVKDPVGNVVRAQTFIANGERYRVNSPASGTWKMIVVGNFSQNSQDIKVTVKKNSTNLTEYSATINSSAFTRSIVADDYMENFKVELNNSNLSKPLHLWISKNGSTPTIAGKITNGSRYTDTNVAKGTNYTAYVTGDFPEGSTEFNLTFFMAKIDAAKISGKTFTDCLNSTDQVGLEIFRGDGPQGRTINVTIVEGLSYDRAAVKNAFDGLTAWGGTPTGEALETATNELMSKSPYFTSGNKTRLPAIVLLTDGLPTLPTPTSNAIEEALTQANATKANGILIYTIGLGVDADMTVLANISSGEGYYFYAATKEDLQAIYSQIARELREIAAKNVVLTDVLPAGIEITSAPGADSITKNADGTTTVVWKVGSVKIFAYGQMPVVKRLVITTMKPDLNTSNVPVLSNATYTDVVTGNVITTELQQPEIRVRPAGGWQMSLE